MSVKDALNLYGTDAHDALVALGLAEDGDLVVVMVSIGFLLPEFLLVFGAFYVDLVAIDRVGVLPQHVQVIVTLLRIKVPL